MASIASPFRSPVTGRAAAAPEWEAPTSAGPAEGEERSDQVADLGAKVPMPEERSVRFSRVSRDAWDAARSARDARVARVAREVFGRIFYVPSVEVEGDANAIG